MQRFQRQDVRWDRRRLGVGSLPLASAVFGGDGEVPRLTDLTHFRIATSLKTRDLAEAESRCGLPPGVLNKWKLNSENIGSICNIIVTVTVSPTDQENEDSAATARITEKRYFRIKSHSAFGGRATAVVASSMVKEYGGRKIRVGLDIKTRSPPHFKEFRKLIRRSLTTGRCAPASLSSGGGRVLEACYSVKMKLVFKSGMYTLLPQRALNSIVLEDEFQTSEELVRLIAESGRPHLEEKNQSLKIVLDSCLFKKDFRTSYDLCRSCIFCTCRFCRYMDEFFD